MRRISDYAANSRHLDIQTTNPCVHQCVIVSPSDYLNSYVFECRLNNLLIRLRVWLSFYSRALSSITLFIVRQLELPFDQSLSRLSMHLSCHSFSCFYFNSPVCICFASPVFCLYLSRPDTQLVDFRTFRIVRLSVRPSIIDQLVSKLTKQRVHQLDSQPIIHMSDQSFSRPTLQYHARFTLPECNLVVTTIPRWSHGIYNVLVWILYRVCIS